MGERERRRRVERVEAQVSLLEVVRIMPGGTLGLLLVLCARVVLAAIKDQCMVLG